VIEMDRTIRKILHKFPFPRKKDQHKALKNYFQAKKTENKTQAAQTADINHQTATKIENTYDDLPEEQKIEFDKFLLEKRIEETGNEEDKGSKAAKKMDEI
jgi:hypothetical protein